MGCSSCGKFASVMQVRNILRQPNVNTNCEYTVEILSDWLTALKCVKNKNLSTSFSITLVKLHSYIGIVKSAINYSTNICYFKVKLDEIKVLVDTIKTSGQC